MNAPGLCRLIAILLPALATFLSQVALAGNIVDPKPSMRPEEMARAELVVLAQYEKHEGASLGLKVLEVLRGKLVKPGDVITVALEHWYSVETGPTGIELLMKSNPKADNVPTLCYKQQIDNPGDVVPIPILPKPTDAALYFFPSEAAPALSAWGQMQPASTAEGWRDILAGRKPGILFRLLETPDQQAAREAVEELARTRDPPAIARLVNLAATPQSRYRSEQSLQSQARNLDPVTILAVIGDQKGDVYDPLLAKIKALPERTLLEQMTAPIPDLHLVLAKVDPDRALRDFSRVVSEGNREEKSAAVRWIAEIKTEASANYLVDLLKQPDLEAQAAKAILLTVKPEVGAHWLFGWEHSHNEEARINRIRLLVQTRVAALANSPDLAELACARLRDLLASLGEPKAPDNMARDEELLRRPETYSSETAASSKGGKLLQAITRRPEPRWVPLLLKMWKEIPAAREYDSSIFRDALLAHASLFPNATRRQLAALGVDDEIRKLGETDHRTTINEVYAADGNPLTLDQVRLVWSHAAFRGRGLTLDPVSYSSEEMAAWRAAWFRSHPLPAELVEKLKGAVEGKIASTRIFGGVVARSDDLQVLCDSDPKAADQILDKYLPDRGKRNNYVRFPLLHTAVQRGRLEFADELLALTRTMAFRADQPCLVLAMLVQRGRKDLAPELIKEVATVREQNLKKYGKSEIEECLPATGDEAALRQYVEWLSAMPRDQRIGRDSSAFPSWEYQKALGCLAAAHPKVYYAQVLTLIQSDSVIDRRVGEKACGVRELGFDAAALAADRAEQLKRVRPICERLGDLSETDRVTLVLRECGCRLQGEPGRAWIPELMKTLAGPDSLVSDRAIWLIGRIMGESFSPPGPDGLRDDDRALLLASWLRDRGVEP